jgi:hypothetical protein
MKKLPALLIPAILFLTACGADKAPDPAASAPAAPSAEPAPAVAAAPALKGRKLAEPLPQGVVLGFPFHYRGQRMVERSDGTSQRRVSVEFLGGDVASTVAQLKLDMAKARFKLAREEAVDGGAQLLVFRKSGYGRVSLTVSPAGTTRLRNAAASGTVFMTWPEPKPAVEQAVTQAP